MWSLIIVALTAGCGRVAFDPRIDAIEPPIHTGIPRVLYFGSAAVRPTTQFDAWVAAQSSAVDNLSASTEITPTLFDGYDVVILRVLGRPFSSSEALVLREFVERGNGLLALTAYGGSAGEAMDFSTLMDATATSAVDAPLTSTFHGTVTMFDPHPITAGLTGLPFDGGYELQLPATGTSLARLQGSVVAGAIEVGRGRIVVWADDWVMFDSEWTMAAKFWTQALAWVWPTS